MRLNRTLITLLALALLTGCARRFHLRESDRERPSSWPMHRKDLGGTGAAVAGRYQGQLDTLWLRKGDKPCGPLTIQHGLLTLPSMRNRLKFYEIETGRYRGQIKFGEAPQSGLLATDSLGFVSVSPPRNTLYGIKLSNQNTLWKLPVKDAPPGSILVSNRLIIGSADGTLFAVNPSDGKIIWRYHVDERFSAAPSYDDGKLYQPSEKGKLHVLAETDGKELYQVNLKGPIVSAAAVEGNAYVGDVLGNFYCLDQRDGAIRWQVALAAPIWTEPVVTGNLVIVAHSGGDLLAFDRESGAKVWNCSLIEVIKASPIVVGDFVVVATMRGTICTLRLSDGSPVAKAQLSTAVEASPVSDGTHVFVVTHDGRILCLGDRNEQPVENHH